MIEVSTRAVAVARAGSVPSSPVYQVTVLAGVPATSAVAVAGGPLTRCGVPLKKLSAAATAEAAASAVLASVSIEPVNGGLQIGGGRGRVDADRELVRPRRRRRRRGQRDDLARPIRAA